MYLNANSCMDQLSLSDNACMDELVNYHPPPRLTQPPPPNYYHHHLEHPPLCFPSCYFPDDLCADVNDRMCLFTEL